jgi:hypothetical protein
LYGKLRDHFDVVFHAPCRYFEGYPFAWTTGRNCVGISAVIEYFDKPQHEALLRNFNESFHPPRQYGSFPAMCGVSSEVPWIHDLKATPLDRFEGGIQFEVNETLRDKDSFMTINFEESRFKCLYPSVKTYQDFLENCQIRFRRNEPFGRTSARYVTFEAYPGTPIIIMLWLLRLLDHTPEACGFGEVKITDRHGLPTDEINSHCLHFSSGLIRWK